MSEEPCLEQEPASLSLCTQCNRIIPRTDTRQCRHAVPCGHIVCSDCIGGIESEQKVRPVSCRGRVCGAVLTAPSEWPTAICARRPHRIMTAWAREFGDQGDVGDIPVADVPVTDKPDDFAGDGGSKKEEKDGARECERHSGERVEFADISSGALLCRMCVAQTEGAAKPSAIHEIPAAAAAAASADEAVTQRARALYALLGHDGNPLTELQGRLRGWCARELKRIRNWEVREINHIRAVANDLCRLIGEVQEHRLKLLPAIYGRRDSIRATLEETEHELRALPEGLIERFRQQHELLADRRRLVSALESGALRAPAPAELAAWCSPPSFARLFGRMEDEREEEEADGAGVGDTEEEEKKGDMAPVLGTLAAGLWTAAQTSLEDYKEHLPVDDAICRVIPHFDRILPEIPRVVSRLSAMRNKNPHAPL